MKRSNEARCGEIELGGGGGRMLKKRGRVFLTGWTEVMVIVWVPVRSILE